MVNASTLASPRGALTVNADPVLVVAVVEAVPLDPVVLVVVLVPLLVPV